MRAETNCIHDEFTACGGDPGWFAAFLLAVYLLVSSILLVNLLIASMASTYERVKSEAHEIWAYQNAEALIEIQSGWLVPAPFSLLLNMYILARAMWRWIAFRCGCVSRVGVEARSSRPLASSMDLQGVALSSVSAEPDEQTSEECRFMARCTDDALRAEQSEDRLKTLGDTLLAVREDIRLTQLMLSHHSSKTGD